MTDRLTANYNRVVSRSKAIELLTEEQLENVPHYYLPTRKGRIQVICRPQPSRVFYGYSTITISKLGPETFRIVTA